MIDKVLFAIAFIVPIAILTWVGTIWLVINAYQEIKEELSNSTHKQTGE